MWFLLLAVQGASEAFLEAQLPLRVLSFSPGNDATSVMIQGKDAITVVFSRPVIALGADFGPMNASSPGSLGVPISMTPFFLIEDLTDQPIKVPGKTRWITTFMARFDPDDIWPPDMQFSAKINQELKTFDGISLSASRFETRYHTSPLSICITSVSSVKASSLTDNRWTPYYVDSVPEVPPDGIINIQFSFPVSKAALLPQLSILRSDSPSTTVAFTSGGCQSSALLQVESTESMQLQSDMVTCVALAPRDLLRNTEYKVVFPQGIRYNPIAGLLRSRVELTVFSLKPFTFPFAISQWNSYSHNQYDLALVHGLTAGQSLNALKNQLSLRTGNVAVSFSLSRPNLGTLRISAAFSPSTTYTLTVAQSNAVLDGFQQPLQSQSVTWTTSPTYSFFTGLDGTPVFEKSQWGNAFWQVLSRGGEGYQPASMSLAPIFPSNVAQMLGYLDSYRSPLPNPTSTVRSNSDSTPRVLNLTVPSSVFIRQGSYGGYQQYFQSAVVSITDLNVAAVTDNSGGLIVWVTKLSSGDSVAGAQIQVLTGPQGLYMGQGQYSPNQLLFQDFTGADGTAYFRLNQANNYGNGLRIYASYGNDAALLPNMYPLAQDSSTLQITMITDRGIYKPGDTVYLKMYARNRVQDRWELPQFSSNCQVSVVWKDNGDTVSLPVQWSDYGTWSGSLNVSNDATYGTRTLLFGADNGVGQGVSILIADPRRPTATMELSSPNSFYRLLPVGRTTPPYPLKVTVLTGTGQPIASAAVEVKWTLRSAFNTSTGILRVVSDQSGSGLYSFDVAQELKNNGLSTVVGPKSHLRFDATWVGPTGELLTSALDTDIDYTNWQLSFAPSWADPLPGFAFGVYVSVTNPSGPVTGRNVNVKLTRLQDQGVSQEDVTSCTAVSNSAYPQCSTLRLPSLGKYRLSATIQDDQGYSLTEEVLLGRNLTEWQAAPLSGLSQIDFRFGKSAYQYGEQAQLIFWSPFAKGTALVRYGNKLGKKQVQVAVTQGLNTIPIPVTTTECKGGCAAAVILSIPRQVPGTFVLPVDLPISLLFDPAAPRFYSAVLPINVQEASNDLRVALSFPQVAEPGNQISIQVTVTSQNQAVQSEIAVVVVDKAFLDLQPSPLAPLASQYQISFGDQSAMYDMRSSLFTYKGYNATISTFLRRVRIDPWIQPNFQTSSYVYAGSAEVDMSDSKYFDQYINSLTSFGTLGWCTTYNPGLASPYGGGPVAQSAIMADVAPIASREIAAAPVPVKDSDTASPSSAGTNIPIRTQFEITPLFVGRLIAASGSATIKLKLPGNIGKFSIRAYAVDKQSRFGQNESFITVQKKLNLQAMLPRISRLGDKFECGVTVAGGDTAFDDDVTVQVEALDSGLVLGSALSQTIRVRGTTPVQVRFSMSAEQLGRQGLRFTALSSGITQSLVQDGLQDFFPVLSVQDPVLVATSMAITANDSGNPWPEGLAFPSAVLGSGSLAITAGVGRYPAILSLSSLLLTPTDPELQNADLQVSRLLASSIIDSYGPSNDPTVSAIRALLPNVRALLQQYTDSRLGLRWSNRWPIMPYDTVDLWLNAYALYQNRISADAFDASLVALWRQALESGLIKQVQTSLADGWTWSDYSLLATVFLGLGSSWTPTGYASNTDVGRILSLDNLLSHRRSMSIGGQATVALIQLLDRNLPNGDQIVTDTINQIISYTRVQGRTAYVVAAPGQANAAYSADQSMCLSVLSKARYAHPFVEKLANYVAQGNSVNQGCFFSFSTRSIGLAVSALRDYDTARQTVNPRVNFKVLGGSSTLIETQFNSPTAPTQSYNASWSALPKLVSKTPAPLTFVARGSGEVSVALALQFVPAQVYTDPIYRGIYVQRLVQLVNSTSGNGEGPSIQAVATGSIVQVTLQISTPDDLQNVDLIDLVPGGFEPIDPNVGSNNVDSVSPIDQGPATYGPIGRGGPATYGGGLVSGDVIVGLPRWTIPWNNPFGTQQTLSDRVMWHATFLAAGSYSVSYKAVVVTLGNWVHPPAKATVAAQPEVMGLSAGSRVLVSNRTLSGAALRTVLANNNIPIASAQPFTPKGCKANCTSSQFCNLRSGICEEVSMRMAPMALNDMQRLSTVTMRACAALSTRQVSFTKLSGSSLRVCWQAPTRTSGCKPAWYRLEYRVAAALGEAPNAWTLPPNGKGITQTCLNVADLKAKSKYEFRILPMEPVTA